MDRLEKDIGIISSKMDLMHLRIDDLREKLAETYITRSESKLQQDETDRRLGLLETSNNRFTIVAVTALLGAVGTLVKETLFK